MQEKVKILNILILIILITVFVPSRGYSPLLSEMENEGQTGEWEKVLQIPLDQLPKINPSIQYNYTLNWTNQVIVLNESVILNQSTVLYIDNCTIEFLPESLSDKVEIVFNSSSKLVINDSILFRNNNSEGISSIDFSGDTVSVQNSAFINLGRNANSPGFFIKEARSAQFLNTNFSSNFRGLTFRNSININISHCLFKDTIQDYSEAIRGEYCDFIAIQNCTFTNMTFLTYGITLQSSTNIDISNCSFKHFGLIGISIESGDNFLNVQNVSLTENSFREGYFGGSISGSNISVKRNDFLNLQGTAMNLGGRFIEVINNNFNNLSRGIITSFSYYLAVAVTDTLIKNNIFTNILNEAIAINNYDGVTQFSFETNNLTNIGTAFAFVGNLGGESESSKSQITGNIIRNTTNYAITGVSWDNLARLQHLEINLNAFFDCKPAYTSFQLDYYYLIDIKWDDGIFGNFWDELNSSSNRLDEDSNLVRDDFFVVNPIHGQVDLAPLLSLFYIFEDDPIGASHPSDFIRTQKELSVNNTLEWEVTRFSGVTAKIWVNNESNTDYSTIANLVKFRLDGLSVGLFNITLELSSNVIFRDTVWVTILPQETDLLTDILIPLGAIGFIVAIVVVFTFGFMKKRK